MPQLVSIATSHSLLWRWRHTHTHTRAVGNSYTYTTQTQMRMRLCVQRSPTPPGHPSWKFAIETETKTKIIIQVWIQGKKLKKQRLFIIVEENYWKSYTLKIKHKKPVEKLCFICFHPTYMRTRVHPHTCKTSCSMLESQQPVLAFERVQHRTIDQHRLRTLTAPLLSHIATFFQHISFNEFHQSKISSHSEWR